MIPTALLCNTVGDRLTLLISRLKSFNKAAAHQNCKGFFQREKERARDKLTTVFCFVANQESKHLKKKCVNDVRFLATPVTLQFTPVSGGSATDGQSFNTCLALRLASLFNAREEFYILLQTCLVFRVGFTSSCQVLVRL